MFYVFCSHIFKESLEKEKWPRESKILKSFHYPLACIKGRIPRVLWLKINKFSKSS